MTTKGSPERKLLILPLCFLLSWVTGSSKCTSNSELRVLFIGNSLTYVNDLPAIVEALARANGDQSLNYRMVALPDYSLPDHWKQGDARKAIAEGHWDIVVLQQGPSALPESRAILREYTRRFATEIRLAGAKPGLYMVWPSVDRQSDFDRVSESYKLAAEDIGGILFPVGEAWRAAWRLDPKLSLYSSDGLHPSVVGSYLAAVTIYAQLYGRSPVGLPSKLKLGSGTEIEVPTEQALMLQKAASEANEKFGRRAVTIQRQVLGPAEMYRATDIDGLQESDSQGRKLSGFADLEESSRWYSSAFNLTLLQDLPSSDGTFSEIQADKTQRIWWVLFRDNVGNYLQLLERRKYN